MIFSRAIGRGSRYRGSCMPTACNFNKKALEVNNEIIVLVDNTTALENARMFALNSGGSVSSYYILTNIFNNYRFMYPMLGGII
ncbi:MAG: hypothetical protein KBE27_08055 [Syntrophorhabdaceae bacterium]|nr:hypothetical protein [Syntrophorhabdales bacterium]MBP9561753.1 hypothetical protein [Syntrophorhabdaceae bacterium]